jgi:hypothetical protein
MSVAILCEYLIVVQRPLTSIRDNKGGSLIAIVVGVVSAVVVVVAAAGVIGITSSFMSK